MRPTVLLAATLMLFSAAAAAMTLNPKAMARFDYSYAKCEAKFPEMRGTRDEAYLSMWRLTADAKARAELAAVRKGEQYQAESKRVREEDAKQLPPAQLEQQCRALWGETQKMRNQRR